MELTLLVLIITIIVSIRRSAWYQRYKVRERPAWVPARTGLGSW